MMAFKSLPKANAKIEELGALLAEKDKRILDLRGYVDDINKAKNDLDRRLAIQAKELEQARKEMQTAQEAHRLADMAHARAAGYIAATKGEPFEPAPVDNFGWRG